MNNSFRRFSLGVSSLVSVFLLGVSCAPREAVSPAHAAQQFYAMLDALGVHEAPDSLSLRALRPFLADSLYDLLQHQLHNNFQNDNSTVQDSGSNAAQEAALVRYPQITGDLFSSLPEGRTNARPVSTVDLPDTGLVVTEFANSSIRPSANWTDTVVAVRERGRWVVADIRYGTTWEFAYRGSLLQLLQPKASDTQFPNQR